jgi:hypothetical protein
MEVRSLSVCKRYQFWYDLEANRLVYVVDDAHVVVLQARYHY